MVYKLTRMKMHNMQKCTHTEDQKMLSGIWGHQKYIMPCTGATRLSKFIKFGNDYLDRGNIQRFLKKSSNKQVGGSRGVHQKNSHGSTLRITRAKKAYGSSAIKLE